jgi:hypothetical protein
MLEYMFQWSDVTVKSNVYQGIVTSLPIEIEIGIEIEKT